MSHDLPSLNALRAFEAAARHQSFKQAATELMVTPAAVSQQIKGLEAHLGQALFWRLNRSIRLTPAGEALFPTVRDAFERMADAVQALSQDEMAGPLTVSVLPSFAAQWLVPRLGRFKERYPDIDVRISAEARVVEFRRDDVDLAVRHGTGPWPGLRIDWLMAGDLFPVCSPSLLDGPHPLRKPRDLRHHVLLHNATRQEWPLWLRMHKVDGVNAGRGPSFSDDGLVMLAAVKGQGVALGRLALAGEELRTGRLVRPFSFVTPSALAYYLVCPETTAERPKIAAFREWIVEEARASSSA
jgi:LysR family glycine cleavage system transcriptional activator